jgi:hypothetical protein
MSVVSSQMEKFVLVFVFCTILLAYIYMIDELLQINNILRLNIFSKMDECCLNAFSSNTKRENVFFAADVVLFELLK